jgi:two-component system, OmpR family, sensor kinase
VSRLPIRLRLTVAFALAMAVVLGATGALLYVRLASSLDETIDDTLDARSAELAPLVGRGDPVGIAGDDDRFVQVVGPGGEVVEASPRLRQEPLLEDVPAQEVRFERDAVPGIDGRTRILARPVDGPEGRVALIVGASLEERDEALAGLVRGFVLLGPVALLVASLLGYALATAAFRPVESMRAEAASISAADLGRRLPLPRARDEVSRLGETLNAMLGRLEAAIERERSFVADASHELRTPLAVLKGELELALRRPRTAPELEAALRSAADETDRLAQLAEDLLVLARADEGRLPLRRTPVSAQAVLEGVAQRFASRASAAGRPLAVEASDGLEVTADAPRLEQALGNLVENALRHGDGAIRLRAVARDGGVELHVEDEGPSFPPGFLPRAFERFSRGDTARARGGSGLGLAIAAAIAEAHGGRALAATRPEGGADVWLVLPGS